MTPTQKRPTLADHAASISNLVSSVEHIAADSLAPSWQSGYGNSYDYQPTYIPPSGPVARVLDYLRQRYGMPDPTIEARRLSAELERAYGKMRDLEMRLEQIRGASS